jgi:hypothetical protein
MLRLHGSASAGDFIMLETHPIAGNRDEQSVTGSLTALPGSGSFCPLGKISTSFKRTFLYGRFWALFGLVAIVTGKTIDRKIVGYCEREG